MLHFLYYCDMWSPTSIEKLKLHSLADQRDEYKKKVKTAQLLMGYVTSERKAYIRSILLVPFRIYK